MSTRFLSRKETILPNSDKSGNYYHDTVVTGLYKRYNGGIPNTYCFPLEEKTNYLVKRMFDVLFSILLIVFLFPWLLPIIFLLIKVNSKGPVFFLQKRKKQNGELFTCIKFRTMIVNEEADILPAAKDDKRITSIGSFLRRHHLDELPQLLNVITGDMSLVGPRPYMINDNEKYEKIIQGYSCRYKVKPGMTGLAQSLGYYGYLSDDKEMGERIKLDNLYVDHWSLKMDITIMYRTLRIVAGLHK